MLGNQSSLSLQNALLHAELERLSVTDRLTDLYNHGYFKQRLDEEFKRAARFGHPMSLIMLDIDDFKAFNDTFGHLRGDALLKAVSNVIRANLRTMDVAARYGGEEFVVVLPETDTAGAVAVAERIREGVERLRSTDRRALRCSRPSPEGWRPSRSTPRRHFGCWNRPMRRCIAPSERVRTEWCQPDSVATATICRERSGEGGGMSLRMALAALPDDRDAAHAAREVIAMLRHSRRRAPPRCVGSAASTGSDIDRVRARARGSWPPAS